MTHTTFTLYKKNHFHTTSKSNSLSSFTLNMMKSPAPSLSGAAPAWALDGNVRLRIGYVFGHVPVSMIFAVLRGAKLGFIARDGVVFSKHRKGPNKSATILFERFFLDGDGGARVAEILQHIDTPGNHFEITYQDARVNPKSGKHEPARFWKVELERERTPRASGDGQKPQASAKITLGSSKKKASKAQNGKKHGGEKPAGNEDPGHSGFNFSKQQPVPKPLTRQEGRESLRWPEGAVQTHVPAAQRPAWADGRLLPMPLQAPAPGASSATAAAAAVAATGLDLKEEPSPVKTAPKPSTKRRIRRAGRKLGAVEPRKDGSLNHPRPGVQARAEVPSWPFSPGEPAAAAAAAEASPRKAKGPGPIAFVRARSVSPLAVAPAGSPTRSDPGVTTFTAESPPYHPTSPAYFPPSPLPEASAP